MQILHISDTHNRHNLLKNLPKADVIVHSGDASFSGSDDEVLDFLNYASHGIRRIGQTTFVNAAILNGVYEFANSPILLEF